jgi:hypothetical protein
LTALSRVFLSEEIIGGEGMLIILSVPVDARYFPRGGVCDADVDAIEVFCFAISWALCFSF